MAVKEVGCAYDGLAIEGSANDVVDEEKGSADAPEEPCLPAVYGPNYTHQQRVWIGQCRRMANRDGPLRQYPTPEATSCLA